MKHLVVSSALTALLSALFIGQLSAQPEVEWERFYGGAREEGCAGVNQMDDAGFMLVGYTLSFGEPHTVDAWVIRVDADGDSLWAERYIGAGYDDHFEGAIQLGDSGYIFGGQTQDQAGTDLFWLVSCDTSGEIDWSTTFGGPHGWSEVYCRDFIPTDDGGYCFTGESDGQDYICVKADSQGHLVWSWYQESEGDQEIDRIVQTTDGGFILAARSEVFWESAAVLIKLSQDGEEEWICEYTQEGQDYYFYDVAETADGNYIAVGNMGAVIVNADGEIVDVHSFYDDAAPGDPQLYYVYYVLPAADGGFTFFGDGGDDYLIRTDAGLDILWSLEISDFEWVSQIIATADGGYALAGTEDNGRNNTDFKVVKMSADPELGVPRWMNVPPAAINEDTELELTFDYLLDYLTDTDDPDSSITLAVEGGAHLAAEIIGDEVIVTPDPDWWGVDSIGLTAFDPAGHSGDISLSVEVIPMNDPPESFSLLAPENGWEVNSHRIAFMWGEAAQNEYELDSIRYSLNFAAGEYRYSIPDLTENSYLVMDYRDLLTAMGIPDTVQQFIILWSVAAQDDSSETACLKPFRLIFYRALSSGEDRIEPLTFTLLPPFPNPFNSRAELVFGLERQSWTTLRIYDHTGHLLERLYEGVGSPGRHNVVWDASGVPAGVYLGRLESDGRSSVVKLAVVR